MKKFLNTAAGSWLKVFLSIFLVQILQAGSIYGLYWPHVIDAAVISFLPVIINALNPADARYGKGHKLTQNQNV